MRRFWVLPSWWWWWKRWLLGVAIGVSILLAVGIARAATPQAFGIQWARIYNIAASQRSDPGRFVSIGCLRYKSIGYACSAKMRSKRTGKTDCVYLLIADDGTVLDGAKAPCGRVA